MGDLTSLGEPLHLPEFWLLPLAFFSSCLAGAMGMGGGVLLITLMPGFVPASALLPVHAITQLASNFSRAAFQWRAIDATLILPFALGAVLGALLGGRVYQFLNADWLYLVVGILVLLFTWAPLPKVQGSGIMALVGLGFYQTGLGMLAGATGPLGGAVLLQRNQDRDWLVVNTGMYMSLNHLLRCVTYGVLGFAFLPWLPLIAALVAAVVAGSWVGTRLRHLIPQSNFELWFRLLLTLLALRMIGTTLLQQWAS